MGPPVLHPGPSPLLLSAAHGSHRGILTPARKEWHSGPDPMKTLTGSKVGLETPLLQCPHTQAEAAPPSASNSSTIQHFGMQFIIIIWGRVRSRSCYPATWTVQWQLSKTPGFCSVGSCHISRYESQNHFIAFFFVVVDVFENLHRMPRGQRKLSEGRIPTSELKPIIPLSLPHGRILLNHLCEPSLPQPVNFHLSHLSQAIFSQHSVNPQTSVSTICTGLRKFNRMSLSDSMQIPLFGKVQGSDFSVASREGICMSFVILLIHPVLVAGRVSLPRGLGKWEPCPHSMSVPIWKSTPGMGWLKAGKWPKQGNDLAKERKNNEKEKRGCRVVRVVGWTVWVWVGTAPCILYKLLWVFQFCGTRALNSARPQGSWQWWRNQESLKYWGCLTQGCPPWERGHTAKAGSSGSVLWAGAW